MNFTKQDLALKFDLKGSKAIHLSESVQGGMLTFKIFSGSREAMVRPVNPAPIKAY